MNYFDEIEDITAIIEALGNLPNYLLEEFIYDEERKAAIKEAISTLNAGGRVIITGRSGCGKTALMAIILTCMLKSGRRVGILRENAPIGNKHLSTGVILFYDDLNKLDKQILVGLARTRKWIATLREEEYTNIAKRVPEIFEQTKMIRISPMKREHLEKMLERYSYREGIVVQPTAKQAIIEKSLIDKKRGLPQYIWLVIRDARIRGITQITPEFVREIPKSILSYTETIIARAIGDAEWEDKITTLAILMMMADAPGYAMDEELIYELYELATGKSGSQALANIARYLVRSGGKLKIPHDSWVDVLKKPDILKYEVARARKKYEEMRKLMGLALERIRAKRGKAEQALKTILASETRRILRELEETTEEVMVERPEAIAIPTATPIDVAREYIQKNPYVRKDAVPKHLEEPIKALVKMDEIIEGREHYYHHEYWRKIVKRIESILAQGKTIPISKITPIADPKDIIDALRAYIVGQYIVSKKWLQQKIVETTKLAGKIAIEQLAQTLRTSQQIIQEASQQNPEVIVINEEIWYKPYYEQKLQEAQKLKELGYRSEKIKQLTGIDITKFKAPSASKIRISCQRWQDYIAYKKQCIKPRLILIQIITGLITVATLLLIIYHIISPQIHYIMIYYIIDPQLWAVLPKEHEMIILLLSRIACVLGITINVGAIIAPIKIRLTKRWSEGKTGQSLAKIVGEALSMILGVVLGMIFGSSIGWLLGRTFGWFLGVILGAIFGSSIGWLLGRLVGIACGGDFSLIFGQFFGGLFGGLLGGFIISWIWLLPLPIWLLYGLMGFCLEYLHRVINNFWRDFALAYFVEEDTLDRSTISSILGRIMDTEDAEYFHGLFARWGFEIIAEVKDSEKNIVKIGTPSEYSKKINNKLVRKLPLVSFKILLPKIDSKLNEHLEGIEFTCMHLRSLANSIKVASWVIKLAERHSSHYVVIDDIVYYVSERGLEKLQRMPMNILAERWRTDIYTLRTIREHLLSS